MNKYNWTMQPDSDDLFHLFEGKSMQALCGFVEIPNKGWIVEDYDRSGPYCKKCSEAYKKQKAETTA